MTFSESISAKVPRLVRDTLAANSSLFKFFEGRISEADTEELELPLTLPSLFITAGNPLVVRNTGGQITRTYPVAVSMALPRLTGALRELTVPSAPVITPKASGSLTGTFRYRITAFSPKGESFASPEVSVTLSGQSAELTFPSLPTGCDGFRIYRSKDGYSFCRFRDVHYGTGTFLDDEPDTVLGDDLAPDTFLPARLTDEISATLYRGENLDDGANNYSDGAFSYQTEDRFSENRNYRIRILRMNFMTESVETTNEPTMG